jgi:hypothetical protein
MGAARGAFAGELEFSVCGGKLDRLAFASAKMDATLRFVLAGPADGLEMDRSSEGGTGGPPGIEGGACTCAIAGVVNKLRRLAKQINCRLPQDEFFIGLRAGT